MIRTDRDLFAAIRLLGLTCRKMDGEYRVAYKYAHEDSAYYTNDRQDALGTAVDMARKMYNCGYPDWLSAELAKYDMAEAGQDAPTVATPPPDGSEWRDVYLENVRPKDITMQEWRGRLSGLARAGLYRGDATGHFGMVRVR